MIAVMILVKLAINMGSSAFFSNKTRPEEASYKMAAFAPGAKSPVTSALAPSGQTKIIIKMAVTSPTEQIRPRIK
jgi:hypothetical protein